MLSDGTKPISSIVQLKNILVPVEFSRTSLKSLQYAVPLAKQFAAKLTILHIATPSFCSPELPDPKPLEAEQLAALEKQLEDIRIARIPADVPVTTLVHCGYAFEGILEVAREIRSDLIITATHGYEGLRHLLVGSVAEHIVRDAPCPVLVVRDLDYDFV